MKKRRKNNIKYSFIVIIFSLFLFGIMILRLTQLALSEKIDGVNLKELASKRTTKTDILSAKRGTIYTSDNEVLAQNVSSYKLIAYLDSKRTTNENNPQHVVDKEKTAELLAPILNMEKDEVLSRLNKEGLYQTEFGSKGKDLNEITKQQIEDLGLPGLDFIESFKRYYPKGNFASYTVGYAKTVTNDNDEEEIVGEMGIEKSFNKLLKGEDGYITYQKDLKGYQIADTNTIKKEAIQGKDIYLTIDSNIQFFVEQALKTADENSDYDWFTISIMDAKTGAILATATSPSFDPNTRNITNYLDNFVASPYEPGSTMKTFTYMAAMENGVYNGSETYLSGTYITSDGTEIGDHERNGWGVITFDKGYAMSSNVAIINMINRHMNSMMLRQYFKKLGFGKKTGIDLPNEQTGTINFKYETEVYNAGFGQGITTTPVQNLKALTSLTNDGILLKPYIVSKIVDSSTKEVILENSRKEEERVASTTTVQKMLQLMDDCVNGTGNTGSGYRIESKELIGKTGTAQIVNDTNSGYLTGMENTIQSFSGIYPKSDPKVIIYASAKKITSGKQKPISNAIKEIVNNLSKYYGISETEEKEIEITKYQVESYINKTLEKTKVKLNSKNINYQILGDGDKIIKQYPKAGDTITNKDTIYLITNSKALKVPNVIGLSSKVAKNLLEELGIKVNLDGVGYVVEQSIAEGEEIKDGMEIKLTLNPKFSVES